MYEHTYTVGRGVYGKVKFQLKSQETDSVAVQSGV